MKISFADLWRPSGTVDRSTYALVGVVGFAVKHNLDRLVATYEFHRPWGLFNYWVPVRDVVRITALQKSEAVFLATMVALSLPFIWVGVVLTIKRLRSARLSPALVLLFFAPVLNLPFFILLCLVPDRQASSVHHGAERKDSVLARVIPESAVGSVAISLLITVPVGVGMVALGTKLLMNYGWGLFVAVPYSMGFAAALIYGMRQSRSMGSCIRVALLSVVLLGLGLMAVAFEGLFCLVMAIPLALPLAIVGGVCGYAVQRRRWLQNGAPAFLSLLLVAVPGVQLTEHKVAARPPIFVVHSSIDIQAAPEQVWRQVIAFTEIPPPKEWVFRSGIAYPIRAEITGSGPGAQRRCVFTTGAFVEPIEIWDEPHRLKFSVTSNPPPMEEWSPYAHLEPPHLHGFLLSEGGQFLLTPLPNGGTRLEGTT